ncbi:MAG TPA: VOC family protein [Methylomirabilota bacterium]|nr:VOC family protein [Methylomirabilota bacterium]
MFQDSQAFSSFAVKDLDAAKRFYGETLGQDVQDGPMGVLELHLAGGTTAMVYPKPDHEPANFTVLNFAVEDIDAAVAKLTSAGVTMEQYGREDMPQDDKGIARDPNGPAIAWFTDPSGNIIAVMKRP